MNGSQMPNMQRGNAPGPNHRMNRPPQRPRYPPRPHMQMPNFMPRAHMMPQRPHRHQQPPPNFRPRMGQRMMPPRGPNGGQGGFIRSNWAPVPGQMRNRPPNLN